MFPPEIMALSCAGIYEKARSALAEKFKSYASSTISVPGRHQ